MSNKNLKVFLIHKVTKEIKDVFIYIASMQIHIVNVCQTKAKSSPHSPISGLRS